MDYDVIVDEIFSDIRKLNKKYEDNFNSKEMGVFYSQYAIEESDKIEKKINSLSLNDLIVLKNKIVEVIKNNNKRLLIMEAFYGSVSGRIKVLEKDRAIKSYEKGRRRH